MVYRGDSLLYPFQLPTPLVFSFGFNILIVKFLLKVSNLPILLVKTGRVYQRNPFLQQSLLIAKFDIQDSSFNVRVLHGILFSFSYISHTQKQIFVENEISRLHIERQKFTALECHTCLPVISLNIFRRHTGTPYAQRWGTVCSVHGRVVGGLSGNPEFYIKLYLLNWPAYIQSPVRSLPHRRYLA